MANLALTLPVPWKAMTADSSLLLCTEHPHPRNWWTEVLTYIWSLVAKNQLSYKSTWLWWIAEYISHCDMTQGSRARPICQGRILHIFITTLFSCFHAMMCALLQKVVNVKYSVCDWASCIDICIRSEDFCRKQCRHSKNASWLGHYAHTSGDAVAFYDVTIPVT